MSRSVLAPRHKGGVAGVETASGAENAPSDAGRLDESGSGASTVHPTRLETPRDTSGEPRSGARDLQLGHTPYRSPQLSGTRTTLMGRGTTVQRPGSLPRSSRRANGSVTGFRLTSS